MASHDFQFSLVLSDEPYFDAMLTDVVRAVLGHVGYSTETMTELAATMRDVLAHGSRTGNQSCRIAFQVRGTELQIGIACAGADEWRTTRQLP